MKIISTLGQSAMGLLLAAAGFAVAAGAAPIDRQALVERHNVVITRPNARTPLQVGNGEFAFSADVTGLQTFLPANTMSHWGWHSFPLPPGDGPEDFKGQLLETHGRQVRYPIANKEQPQLSTWLSQNPHRFNLGRLGLRLTLADGRRAKLEDLKEIHQELDLWRGVITSTYRVEGQPVRVETVCHPERDLVAVRIESPLLGAGRLAVALEFPYATAQEFASEDWSKPEAHRTVLQAGGANQANLERTLDATNYNVRLKWSDGGRLAEEKKHTFILSPAAGGASVLAFACEFTPGKNSADLPDFARIKDAAAAHWAAFWRSGGAIDLSGSRDPRWSELERRIVLSQYLLAVNDAGSLPPQESGLVNNGWHGRFHFEMIWWHEAHFALWDRWPLAQGSVDVYRKFLDSARAHAREQGYRGARWPKCTGPDGREWPNPIHAQLLWQQPHPMFFAELDWRLHPTSATLEKWREVLFATADFMASYAWRNPETGRYDLGPPLYVVSENTRPEATRNPAFELAYWRFGLRIAQQWRERLGLARDAEWDRVLQGLAPLPVENGLYVLHEGVSDMWTRWNFEHPALIGVRGWLPGDGTDPTVAKATLDKVWKDWQWARCWGWDFPMLAMAAARNGEPKMAVDALMLDSPKNGYALNGFSGGGPYPYFPANGGLLYAVALMAAGWDGAPDKHAPGFPDDGSWTVRWEGLKPAL